MDTQADAQKARYKANASTAMGNLNKRLDNNTKRMAGVALAAGLSPALMAMVDDQETDILGVLAYTLGTPAAAGLGAYLGYRNSNIPEEVRHRFIRDEINKIKKDSKVIAEGAGPEIAAQDFARKKQMLLDDVTSIDPARAAVINERLGKIPLIGSTLKAQDLGNKTPRDVRGMSRGALAGALLSVIPAYLALRNGDVQDTQSI